MQDQNKDSLSAVADSSAGTSTPNSTPDTAPATACAPTTAKPRKKLSLDISDVSEVLERKISP